MRILSVDITGKVSKYDDALFASLLKMHSADNEILCMTPYRKYTNNPNSKESLYCFVPEKKAHVSSLGKRIVKAFECFFNYVYLLKLLIKNKPDVLHLQWLPFMEISSIEIPILKCLKMASSKTKIVLTIHNIYPHNMNCDRKKAYKKRFVKACKFIDSFIVHTKVSKQEVVENFGLRPEGVFVCYHGVFGSSVNIGNKSKSDGKFRILQFGGQSKYKGTDLLVKAVCGLSPIYKSKFETRIVGGINQKFLEELKEIDTNGDITWKPYFLSDKELHEEILASDLVVLPYRAISQSGVLLLSIYFKKLIICSDLLSFKETLRGEFNNDLDEDLFFKSEDVNSLQNLIVRYVDGNINKDAIYQRMNSLKELYSWDNAALMTWNVYTDKFSH